MASKTPQDFYLAYKDRAVCHLSGATTNYQCVCAFKEFLWWCGAGYGQNSHDSVGGNANQLPNGLHSKYAQHFVKLSRGHKLQNGDWLIWAYDGTGHIAMYINGQAFGQNQGVSGVPKGSEGGQKFTLVNRRDMNNILGGWRWKEWSNGVPEMDLSVLGQPGISVNDVISNETMSVTSVDWTQLTPYVIELNQSSPDTIDWDKMKVAKVSGVLVEGGAYFDKDHKKRDYFRNTKVDTQVAEAAKAEIAYGLYLTARAKSVDDVKHEIKEFKYLIYKYPPALGAWLKLELQEDKEKNKEIIERYQQEFEFLGLKYKIGFMCTEDELDTQIEWADYKDDWLLWVDNHIENLSEINRLLDPMFFDIPYTGVPDMSVYDEGTYASTGGKYDEAKASDLQRRIVANAKANNGTKAAVKNMCGAWVAGIYEKSGLSYPSVPTAYEWWPKWKSSGSTDTNNVPLGAAVIFNRSGSNINCGHIGIYVGGGKIAHNRGGVGIQTIAEVASWTGASAVGWVWPHGKALQQPSETTSNTSGAVAAVAGVSSADVAKITNWRTGPASAYGGPTDASAPYGNLCADGTKLTASLMGVAIPLRWGRRDLLGHKIYIKYNGKVVLATIHDLGGMPKADIDLQPAVFGALSGLTSCSAWGIRQIQYSIQ